ncbi:hypothetical protein CHS0354_018485 [Potamilus streckersoni]|uniref:Uncharacterized protein n=1 Tax=Potamilus streckersoni TaxID=2493646 RepID=A0AAE0TAQ5_9BIVA|nr:hypothetical protein CHS0354_018485 [Potamilus streckersoni]
MTQVWQHTALLTLLLLKVFNSRRRLPLLENGRSERIGILQIKCSLYVIRSGRTSDISVCKGSVEEYSVGSVLSKYTPPDTAPPTASIISQLQSQYAVSAQGEGGVAAYCLKDTPATNVVPSTPQSSDSCWVSVPPHTVTSGSVDTYSNTAVSYNYQGTGGRTLWLWGKGQINDAVAPSAADSQWVAVSPEQKNFNVSAYAKLAYDPASDPESGSHTIRAWALELTLGDVNWPRYLKVSNVPAGRTVTLTFTDNGVSRTSSGTSAGSDFYDVSGQSDFDFYNLMSETTGAVDLKVTVQNCEPLSFKLTKKPYGNIYDWHDLQNMQYKLNGTYTLIQDILFPVSGSSGFPAAGFTPVGSGSAPFTGILNGQGKEIKDFYMDGTQTGNIGGVFSGISGGVIRNIRFNNPVIKSNGNTGTVSAHIYNNGEITDLMSVLPAAELRQQP